MNETQAEIQRIQAKLQEIGQNTRRRSPRLPQVVTQRPADPPGRSPDLPRTLIAEPCPDPDLPGRDHPKQPSPSLSPESLPLGPSLADRGYIEAGTVLNVRPPVLQPDRATHLSKTESPPPPSGPADTPPMRSLTPNHQRLDQQAQRINQLSSALEAALLDMKTVATQLERQHPHQPSRLIWASQEVSSSDPANGSQSFRSSLPHVERDAQGVFVLKVRSIDGLPSSHPVVPAPGELSTPMPDSGRLDSGRLAEWQAQQVADQLRQQTALRGEYHPPQPADRRSRLRGMGGVFLRVLVPLGRQMGILLGFNGARSESSPSRTSVQVAQASPPVKITIQDVVLWVAGAAIARVALDLLLISYPALWLPVAAMVVTPAAIAIYCTAVDPDSSFTMGRRLLFIMIGLLIGGRLS